MNDFLLAVECVFSNTWMLLTSIDFPGTEISIAQILVGSFLACFSLRVLAHALGFRVAAGDIPVSRPDPSLPLLPKGVKK